jgi:protein-S-isoprenylcysteine O-methyltransferase Ste14
MTDQAPDNPNVVILPPILLLATIITGIVLDWLVPIGIFETVPRTPRMVVGVILFVLGASMTVTARRAFHESQTNIRPDKQTMAIITSGLYAHVRNPIYQGAAIALLGLALMLGSDWIPILMVPMLLVLHYGVVLREERYLEKKFGEAYRRYTSEVPRYGWKF